MPISLQKSNQLKAIAIMMMLCLHLFNRDHRGLFQPLIFLGEKPLSYYISLFCDACVPIFAFVSGYGLYFKYRQNKELYAKGNRVRIRKLYINYWLIILIFAVFLGFLLHKEGYPGSWQKLLLNITAINPSYNGAWWFFTTYVLFVLTSSFWFRILNSINPWLFLGILTGVYFVSFYLRVYRGGLFQQELAEWFYRQSYLYFCTLFQFMLGAFALKFDWAQKVARVFRPMPFKTMVAVLGVIALIVFHGVLPNFIVAPFTGLAFIFLFLQIKLPSFLDRFLDFMAIHATNLWLIHMFFYMIYFQDFIYGFKCIILIYMALIGLCLISSMIINILNKKVQQWL